MDATARTIEQMRLQTGYIMKSGLEVKTACIAASLVVIGAPNTNRTCDLPLRRGLLYPLSYRGGRPYFSPKWRDAEKLSWRRPRRERVTGRADGGLG